jgi:hypothetical protein
VPSRNIAALIAANDLPRSTDHPATAIATLLMANADLAKRVQAISNLEPAVDMFCRMSDR